MATTGEKARTGSTAVVAYLLLALVGLHVVYITSPLWWPSAGPESRDDQLGTVGRAAAIATLTLALSLLGSEWMWARRGYKRLVVSFAAALSVALGVAVTALGLYEPVGGGTPLVALGLLWLGIGAGHLMVLRGQ